MFACGIGDRWRLPWGLSMAVSCWAASQLSAPQALAGSDQERPRTLAEQQATIDALATPLLNRLKQETELRQKTHEQETVVDRFKMQSLAAEGRLVSAQEAQQAYRKALPVRLRAAEEKVARATHDLLRASDQLRALPSGASVLVFQTVEFELEQAKIELHDLKSHTKKDDLTNLEKEVKKANDTVRELHCGLTTAELTLRNMETELAALRSSGEERRALTLLDQAIRLQDLALCDRARQQALLGQAEAKIREARLILRSEEAKRTGARFGVIRQRIAEGSRGNGTGQPSP